LNVLYLISYAGRGGAEKYVENLMEICSSQGWGCRLAYWEEGPLSRKAAAASVPVLRLDLRRRNTLRAARELAGYCRDNAVDVIHAQFPRENVIAVLSRLFRPSTRVVYTDHLTVEQGAKWRLINRLITPRNTAVAALYAGAVPQLEKNGVDPRRVRVIPNGVEAGPLPPRQNAIRREFGLGEDCFVFLTLARFAPEKGAETLLSAAQKLRSMTDRPFVCLMAGEGEGLEPFRREVARRGLEKTVLCPGYRSDARALLCSADAYVSPSLSEAMSYSILEAMSCGLPLAVTDTGAGRELAEGCGLVSAPGDDKALAENMLRLMTDDAAGAAMGAEAYRRVTGEYSLSRQAEALSALYAGEK
jgi:glycosyltransferase involved in cell wall biosynthesis